MIKITKKTSTAKTTAKYGRKIEWIMLHYTAGTRSTAGAAVSVANMFKTSNIQASADFIVDDSTIVQYNGDIKNRYTWAVGGSKYTSMSTSLGGKYYEKASNSNSISIEMCSSKKNTKTLLATDTDWYFTDDVISNTVDLVKMLMNQYKIKPDHVIMHHMRTGKICPNPWCVNEKALTGYYNFIKRISTTISMPCISVKKAYLRSSPAVGNSTKVKYSSLSDAIKVKCTEDKDGYAKFLADKKFTCVDTYHDSNGNIWYKIKSGYWLPAVYNKIVKAKER